MKSSRITKCILFILWIIPLIIMPWNVDYFYAPKIYAVLCVVLYMIWLSRKPEDLLATYNPKENLWLSIYFVLILVSTLLSKNIGVAIYGTKLREEGLIAIFVYISIFLFAKKYFKFEDKQIFWLTLSAIIIAAYGIMQYYGFDPIPRDEFRQNWGSTAFSTIGNPNFLGTYIVLMLPISAFYWISSRKYFYYISSCLLYFCLMLTRTRGTWIGAFAALLLLALFIFKYKVYIKRYIILISAFIIITGFINVTSDNILAARFSTIVKDATAVVTQNEEAVKAGSYRYYIWTKVVDLIKQHPVFGIGLENLGIVSSEQFMEETIKVSNGEMSFFDKAHNEYLHIAVTTGVPSLFAYLIFVGSILYKGFKKGIKSSNANSALLPFMCSITGYLVQAFFNISIVSVAFIYWIFLGIVMNLSINGQSNSRIIN